MSEPERVRLFVAADVPEEQRRAVTAAVARARPPTWGGRWTRPENQHLTLKFLGWTAADRVDAVASAAAVVARSHSSARDLRLASIGAFPSLRRARVLWAGLEGPTELLAHLAADLDRAFEPLGYVAEKRPFTPHLTLARFGTPVRLEGALPDRPWGDLEPFDVAELRLYRSHLHPSGARYEPLASFALAPG